MATTNKINSHEQVKEINNKRWLCQRVIMSATTSSADYDFVDNADGKLWKKVRPWKQSDLKSFDVAGQSTDDQVTQDTNLYTNNDYVGDYVE